MELKEIGKRIRNIRQGLGLSQDNIASELGISITAYSKIERGLTNIPFLRLCQLADCFKISLLFLLNDRIENIEDISMGNNSLNEPNVVYKPQNEILFLNQEISRLKELLVAKNEIIDLLRIEKKKKTS